MLSFFVLYYITTMPISVCKSDYFTDRSREVFLSCSPEEGKKQSDGNYYCPKFIDVFILSTTSLEAFINERIAISLEICRRRLELNDPVNKDTLDSDRFHVKILHRAIRDNLREKYLKIPQKLWGKTFDKSKSPFHDFESLVEIRNDIIHYKMPFYEEQNADPSWANEISIKGLFMSEPVIIPPFSLAEGNQRVWIDEICTYKAAQWAHNTSCKMIKQFIEMSKGIIRNTTEDYAEYFIEV